MKGSSNRRPGALWLVACLAFAFGAVAITSGHAPASVKTAAISAASTSDGRIVFVRNGGDLWIMNDDGNQQTALLSNVEGGIRAPVLSADGAKIAFVRFILADPPTEDAFRISYVYVMNDDGSNPIRLTEGVSPEFSPDGTRIAFSRTGATDRGIYVMYADGSGVTRLTSDLDQNPTFSPDATKIAFDSQRDRHSEIYIMDADGTDQTRLTYNGQGVDGDYAVGPDISPDGLRIAYTRRVNNPYHIVVMDIDGSNPSEFTTTLSHSDLDPTFSPDGTKIAFQSDRDAQDPTYYQSIYSMNSDGTGVARLTNAAATDSQPTWGGAGTPMPSVGASYVAMGDSYSSGEGSYDYYTESDSISNTCHRSPHAYGPLLADELGITDMIFSACSGAFTVDFLHPNHSNPSEPAQLERGLGPSTKIVTLTLGGNDSGFGPVLNACTVGFRPDGPPGSFGCSRNKTIQENVDARLTTLDGRQTKSPIDGLPITRLSEIYKQISLRAPGATIYVGGYPRLFGNDKRYYQKAESAPSGSVCQVGSLNDYYVDYKDAQWINKQADRLNDVINRQVKAAKFAGYRVEFVPVNFAGSSLCDSGEPWVHGVNVVADESGALKMESSTYHPTEFGQLLYYGFFLGPVREDVS